MCIFYIAITQPAEEIYRQFQEISEYNFFIYFRAEMNEIQKEIEKIFKKMDK